MTCVMMATVECNNRLQPRRSCVAGAHVALQVTIHVIERGCTFVQACVVLHMGETAIKHPGVDYRMIGLVHVKQQALVLFRNLWFERACGRQ